MSGTNRSLMTGRGRRSGPRTGQFVPGNKWREINITQTNCPEDEPRESTHRRVYTRLEQDIYDIADNPDQVLFVLEDIIMYCKQCIPTRINFL